MKQRGFGGRDAGIDWPDRAPTTAERREADAFLTALLGKPAPRFLAHAPSGPALVRALNGESWPEEPDVKPPVTGLCAKDVAVTDKMALLVTRSAPLPVTCDERMRVVKDAGAQDDYKSVAAIVPDPREARLLVFFHGDFSYVTIAPVGDVDKKVDPSGHSRVPRWIDKDRRPFAAATRATPIEFKLEDLAQAQRDIPWTAAFKDKGLVIKDPVVLVPEDGELHQNKKDLGRFSVPPQCQYGVEGDGTPTGPGTRRLEELVKECYEHLRCLPKKTGGQTYLGPGTAKPGTWIDNNISRLYLAAHSGGGKPLLETAGADMALMTATSAAGKNDRAVDLWLLDASYRFGVENYVNFCMNWKNAGKLGYGKDRTRIVCVFNPASDTGPGTEDLRQALAKALAVRPDTLLHVHESRDMAHESMVKDVIPALLSQPVVFVQTKVKHMDIPTKFLPLLLLTAAS